MTSMRRVRPDLGSTEEIPAADAAEQRLDVVDLTDTAQQDADRVVLLDDEDYR